MIVSGENRVQHQAESVDVVVIGAGPGGIAAALTAARLGARTVLLDEAEAPGGSLVWEVADFDELPATPGVLTLSPLAASAAAELLESDVAYYPRTSVWAIFPDRVVAAYDTANATGRTYQAKAIVIASGTVDRTWPVRGWELPGFYSERQLLKRLHAELPPPALRYAIIGGGTATDQTRAAIALTGGEIVFESVDINTVRIDGDRRVERIEDKDARANVDVVVEAFGKRIDPTLAIQAGAICTLHVGEGVPTPYLTPDGSTSIAGIFVAGEAAGVPSARWAYAHGERVGEAAVKGSEPHPVPEPIILDRNNPRRTFFPPPRDPEIIVDREQNVTLREIVDVIDAGAWDINDVRRQTRAGMGASSAHEALPVLAALLLRTHPWIDDARLIARPRPPIRPVPFAGYLPEETDLTTPTALTGSPA